MKYNLGPNDFINDFDWKDIITPFLIALCVKYIDYFDVFIYKLYAGLLINHLIYWNLHSRINSFLGRVLTDIMLILLLVILHLVGDPSELPSMLNGLALSVFGSIALIIVAEIINTLLLIFTNHLIKKIREI